MSELIEEMNEINKYLSDFIKVSQLDWLVEDKNYDFHLKKHIDIDTLFTLFNEVRCEAKDKNSKRVLEIITYLYDLEIIDQTFHMMIVNLLLDEDYNQIVLAIDSYIFMM